MVSSFREFVLLDGNFLLNYWLLDLLNELDSRSLFCAAAMVFHLSVDFGDSWSTEAAIGLVIDREFDISLAETFHETWLFFLLRNVNLALGVVCCLHGAIIELGIRRQQPHRR